MTRISTGFFATLLLTGFAVACSGGDGTGTPRPQRTPIVDGVTFTDFLGRSVTAPRNPARVVALSPTTVELVYAVGGSLVGRASSANYPSEAQTVPDVGSSYQPNTEEILAASPDLVVADSVIQSDRQRELEGLGLTVMFVGAERFADVPRALRLVGLATGRDDAGEGAAAALEAKLQGLQDRIVHTHPLILIINGTPTDYFAATQASYVGDLVLQLGGRNAAEGQPTVGRFSGYAKISAEAVLAANPDLILAISAVSEGNQTVSQSLKADPLWSSLEAVAQDKIFEIDSRLFLLAPGPRVGVALDVLFGILYPGRS